MAEPEDQGFELNGVLFGQKGQILVEDFQPGGYEWRNQDAPLPMDDVQLMGRDFKTPGAWVWTLGINRDDEAGAMETLEALAAAWDTEEVAKIPGAYAAMRYRVNGRTRRVYGRPRRFTPTLDVRRLQGYVKVDADFARVDTLHYDDEEQSVVLTMQPASTGGLFSPLVSPLTSYNDSADASRAGQVVVGGTVPTSVIVEIAGDIARPWVEAAGLWRISLETVIAEGDTATIDARPWVRSSTLANGGSVAGAMRGARMAELLLPPGSHELTFGGTSSTGGATATVRWRAASKTL